MTFGYKKTCIAVLAAGAVATASLAASHQGKSSNGAVNARHAQMQMVGYSIGVLGAVAKGEMEYSAEMVDSAAKNLQALARMDKATLWVAGTEQGAVDGSRAKAEIWSDPEGFAAAFVKMDEAATARRKVFVTALFFVLGLSTIFVLLGLAASTMGRALLQAQGWFVPIAGMVVMIFGAHFIGVFRIGFLDREVRMQTGDRGGSAFGAYILGLAFAFGWTPCLGPILAAILSLALSEGDVARGTVLMGVYALGLGIPFLLVAGFFPRLKGVMAWMKRNLDRIERISGLLLWTVGLMMVTGQFTAFSFWLLEQFPALATIG